MSEAATRSERRWSAARFPAGAFTASKYQYMCPWLQECKRLGASNKALDAAFALCLNGKSLAGST